MKNNRLNKIKQHKITKKYSEHLIIKNQISEYQEKNIQFIK